ncbi:MAG: hypothetical protein AB7H71_12185 [Alphaproteobacteria bacterium]
MSDLSQLIAKRAELAGIIAQLQREIDQYRADLIHIDGALRLLRSDLDPETIRPRRRYTRTQYFGRNELSRLCMDTLRQAAGPLTSAEITARIMTAKGLDARDARLRAAIRVQAGAVLKRLHRQKIAAPSGKGIGSTWLLLSNEYLGVECQR